MGRGSIGLGRTWLIGMRIAGAVALTTISAAVGPGSAPAALAIAPGLATVRYDAPLLASPDNATTVIATLSAGSEVELSGATAPGYVEVTANGQTGWISADALSVSGRPGLGMAVAIDGTSIYAAPLPDAGVLGNVPPGGAVILTGAHVGVYVAASFDGVGGWLLESDLDLPFDEDGSAR